MMMFDFDAEINRTGTDCVKYDLRNTLFGNPDVFPMWVADMDFATPDFILEALHARVSHPVLGYSFRPESFGRSLANWLSRRHGYNPDAGEVCFSPGLVSGLLLLTEAFTQPGDAIIVQPPVYHPFFEVPEKNNRKVLYNQLIYDGRGYTMDFDQLEAIAPQAKMLFLCNPHNPVGRAWSPDELLKLADICLRHSILMVSDEIHSDLLLPPYRHTPLASLSPEIARETISCYAPSKTFNLAGLSTSAIVISDPAKRKVYNQTLERLHMQMGNVMGHIAFVAAYENGDVWLDSLLEYLNESVRQAADIVRNQLSPVRWVQPEATYLLWLDFRELGIEGVELNRKIINEAGIALSPGYQFGPGGEGFMRMNIACPRHSMLSALDGIAKMIKA